MDQKIDLGSTDALPTYKAHLVPCKIRYSGATSEFQDNFVMDNKHRQCLAKSDADQHCNASQVTYIRGRKIVGREVLNSKDYSAFLMSSSADASDELTMKPIAQVTHIVNYERDGNEERLDEELTKFNELLEVSEVIHS